MRTCVRCGESFAPVRKNNVKCPDCKGKIWKSNACSDCGIPVYPQNKRCSQCDDKGKRGNGNHNYKGRRFTTQGYVLINEPEHRDHPNAQATGYIAEHILVMTQHLGRPLVKGEEVHHKNGVRSDNRIENLELWTRSHPTGVRVADLYTWCLDYIEQYRSDFDKLI